MQDQSIEERSLPKRNPKNPFFKIPFHLPLFPPGSLFGPSLLHRSPSPVWEGKFNKSCVIIVQCTVSRHNKDGASDVESPRSGKIGRSPEQSLQPIRYIGKLTKTCWWQPPAGRELHFCFTESFATTEFLWQWVLIKSGKNEMGFGWRWSLLQYGVQLSSLLPQSEPPSPQYPPPPPPSPSHLGWQAGPWQATGASSSRPSLLLLLCPPAGDWSGLGSSCCCCCWKPRVAITGPPASYLSTFQQQALALPTSTSLARTWWGMQSSSGKRCFRDITSTHIQACFLPPIYLLREQVQAIALPTSTSLDEGNTLIIPLTPIYTQTYPTNVSNLIHLHNFCLFSLHNSSKALSKRCYLARTCLAISILTCLRAR